MAPSSASNVVPFPTPGRPSEELLADLAAARPEAVATVYRRHAAKVRGFARRMLHDDVAAEDVVHDAFVALPKAVSRFRGDCALDTFLISIAVNMCRRRLRSRERGRRAVETLTHQVEEPVETPEAETRRRQLAAALRRGLETLSVDHREVFVLCAVEERTSVEVGEILDIPAATVRTRLFHARKQLRAFLEREGFR